MKLAVVRVRGIAKINPRINKTLELIKLAKPNNCVFIEDTPQNRGMLLVIKDYVTFGPVNEETVYKMLYKRGSKGSVSLRDSMKEAELKKAAKEIFGGKKTAEFADPVFRLSPPSKGFKNIKLPYPRGDLGMRAEDINVLLKRMM
ncbi:uL30 family ribosomal protein [Candidatus Micrarchaeota archaeon]|nr:uL30 family ribosomal protein [Candidatus Micrarchaeota archaeon]